MGCSGGSGGGCCADCRKQSADSSSAVGPGTEPLKGATSSTDGGRPGKGATDAGRGLEPIQSAAVAVLPDDSGRATVPGVPVAGAGMPSAKPQATVKPESLGAPSPSALCLCACVCAPRMAFQPAGVNWYFGPPVNATQIRPNVPGTVGAGVPGIRTSSQSGVTSGQAFGVQGAMPGAHVEFGAKWWQDPKKAPTGFAVGFPNLRPVPSESGAFRGNGLDRLSEGAVSAVESRFESSQSGLYGTPAQEVDQADRRDQEFIPAASWRTPDAPLRADSTHGAHLPSASVRPDDSLPRGGLMVLKRAPARAVFPLHAGSLGGGIDLGVGAGSAPDPAPWREDGVRASGIWKERDSSPVFPPQGPMTPDPDDAGVRGAPISPPHGRPIHEPSSAFVAASIAPYGVLESLDGGFAPDFPKVMMAATDADSGRSSDPLRRQMQLKVGSLALKGGVPWEGTPAMSGYSSRDVLSSGVVPKGGAGGLALGMPGLSGRSPVGQSIRGKLGIPRGRSDGTFAGAVSAYRTIIETKREVQYLATMAIPDAIRTLEKARENLNMTIAGEIEAALAGDVGAQERLERAQRALVAAAVDLEEKRNRLSKRILLVDSPVAGAVLNPRIDAYVRSKGGADPDRLAKLARAEALRQADYYVRFGLGHEMKAAERFQRKILRWSGGAASEADMGFALQAYLAGGSIVANRDRITSASARLANSSRAPRGEDNWREVRGAVLHETRKVAERAENNAAVASRMGKEAEGRTEAAWNAVREAEGGVDTVEKMEQYKKAREEAIAAREAADAAKEAAEKARADYARRRTDKSRAQRVARARQARREAKAKNKALKRAQRNLKYAARSGDSRAKEHWAKEVEKREKEAKDATENLEKVVDEVENPPPPPPEAPAAGQPPVVPPPPSRPVVTEPTLFVGEPSEDSPVDTGMGCGEGARCGGDLCPKCLEPEEVCIYCGWVTVPIPGKGKGLAPPPPLAPCDAGYPARPSGAMGSWEPPDTAMPVPDAPLEGAWAGGSDEASLEEPGDESWALKEAEKEGREELKRLVDEGLREWRQREAEMAPDFGLGSPEQGGLNDSGFEPTTGFTGRDANRVLAAVSPLRYFYRDYKKWARRDNDFKNEWEKRGDTGGTVDVEIDWTRSRVVQGLQEQTFVIPLSGGYSFVIPDSVVKRDINGRPVGLKGEITLPQVAFLARRDVIPGIANEVVDPEEYARSMRELFPWEVVSQTLRDFPFPVDQGPAVIIHLRSLERELAGGPPVAYGPGPVMTSLSVEEAAAMRGYSIPSMAALDYVSDEVKLKRAFPESMTRMREGGEHLDRESAARTILKRRHDHWKQYNRNVQLGSTQLPSEYVKALQEREDVKGHLRDAAVFVALGAAPKVGVLARRGAARILARVRVGVHGGEAGVSSAERVGKFFGIYPNAANPARQAVLVERYVAKGYTREVAEALAKPYKGMGEHFLPRRALRAVGIPERALDSPFTVLMPRGISYGEMFELHFGVDSHFYGASFGLRSQLRWSGLKVGAERFGALGSAWYGTPIAVKATGAAAGASYWIYKATQSPPDSATTQDSETPR